MAWHGIGPVMPHQIVERLGWVAGNYSTGAPETSGPPPLFIFMGLDKTIECLIAAMNLTDSELTTQKVPHGGALLFELHRMDDEYFVRTLYRNGVVPKMYRTLLLSGTANMTCTNTGMCPVDEFNKYGNRLTGETWLLGVSLGIERAGGETACRIGLWFSPL